MSDDSKVGILNSIDPALTALPSTKEKNAQVDGNEFIQLLVTQLKNQDPLDPMDNDEFAVKLAQFSQLEQLIGINDKLGAGGGDFSSMAAYLGHEVTLNSNTVEIHNGEADKIKFDLANDASKVEVDLVDKNDSVVETIDLGALSAGKQSVALSDLVTQSGEYSVRVRATDMIGGAFEAEVHVAGVVSGFVPGPEPMLIIGKREASPSEILEVGVADEE
ncbi:hypothetical protein OAO01_08480 [Oligoflexia bacterium]|nr:hypothetical protein [Oligoflexia bacterium]